MSQIEVPDWVAQAYIAAYHHAYDTEELPYMDSVKAALTAALGAWVVPLIEADEEYDDLRDRLFLLMMADPRRDGLLKQINEADKRRRAALTALRQEKPE